jgi:hypothetical protein
MESELIHNVFSVSSADFNEVALSLFHFQYNNNLLYHEFVNALKIPVSSILRYEQIPFLPIHFFKTHKVMTTGFEPELIFESSGTTGTINSRHHIRQSAIYRRSFLAAFEMFYDKPEDWCIIGLLPSYLERHNSSLVKMVDELIRMSNHKESGFYLYDHDQLNRVLQELEKSGRKTLLIGVTFALLDFAEQYRLQLRNTIVMETGGMKGRKEELTREEVHDILKQRLGVSSVHAEYGMTELLSQAYSKKDGLFQAPPWMKILIRDEDDPFVIRADSGISNDRVTGVINVIDLANIYSCAFIATDDAGRLYRDGSFEVIGRVDASDIRGCSLMVM